MDEIVFRLFSTKKVQEDFFDRIEEGIISTSRKTALI